MRTVVLSTLVIGLTTAGQAQAQVIPLQREAESPGSANSAGDTEIVVTANKREQRFNDVGATISVISANQLQEKGLRSVADLAGFVPGLTYANSANGTPVYTLRGVGFYESSLGAYPTVSVYVDEAPLPFSILTKRAAFDLERVEVLKGPQGTLFGQNATGGAINLIAAKPTSTFAAGGALTYGRFDQVIADAFLSGPITDNLAFRVAGHFERADGWQFSNSHPSDRLGKIKNYAVRAAAQFTTGPVTSILTLSGSQDNTQPQAPQFVALTPQNPLLSPLLIASRFSPTKPRAADWTPGLPFSDGRQLQAQWRNDIDLGAGVTLTSVTSYIDYRQRQADDGDGLPIFVLDLTQDDGKIRTLYQELRLSNAATSRARWVVGVNYDHSRVDQTATVLPSDSSANQTLGVFLGYPLRDDQYYSYQKLRNYAFFGNMEFDIVPTVTIKAGVRYTNSLATARSCSRDTSGLSNSVGAFIYDIVLGGAFGSYPRDACFSINNLEGTVNGVAVGAPGEYAGRLSENNVSWRGGIDWKVAPSVLLYANASKGYKAGSFPTVSASAFSQYLPVTQESVLAYEAGIKASALDRALQLDAAGFYYDYKNKQVRGKLNAIPFGLLDVLQNVPKSRIYGAELNFTARPDRNLSVKASFTYINSRITDYTGLNARNIQTNFAGTELPYTPKFSTTVGVRYERPVGSQLSAFASAQISLQSSSIATLGGRTDGRLASDGKPLFVIKDYTITDATLGIKDQNERWSLFLWGKNILDSYYWNNVVLAYDVGVRYAGRPATYGLTATLKY